MASAVNLARDRERLRQLGGSRPPLRGHALQPAESLPGGFSRDGQLVLGDRALECPVVDHHAAKCAAAADQQRDRPDDVAVLSAALGRMELVPRTRPCGCGS